MQQTRDQAIEQLRGLDEQAAAVRRAHGIHAPGEQLTWYSLGYEWDVRAEADGFGGGLVQWRANTGVGDENIEVKDSRACETEELAEQLARLLHHFDRTEDCYCGDELRALLALSDEEIRARYKEIEDWDSD